MEYVGVAATVASTIFGASAASRQGEQQHAAADYSASVDEQNAGQQQAASQRAAAEERRKSRFAQSRAIAVAAASGASASDPGVAGIISNLSAEGTYRSMVDLYQGEDAARQLRQSAATKRYGGAIAEQAGNTNATATILKGGASLLWAKYSGGFKNADSGAGSGPGIGYGMTDPTMSGIEGFPY